MTDLSELAPRIVRCTIEMELFEGRDFPSSKTDEDAIFEASIAFLKLIKEGMRYQNLVEYVQPKLRVDIVEEVS